MRLLVRRETARETFRNAWLLLALAIASAYGFAQERVIWRIGTFDQASGEFRAKSDDYSNPKFDAVYRVGTSLIDPKKDSEDWQRFQPGPANGMAGGREHPFTILFDLHDPLSGVYRLKIGILYETPRLSYLRVNLNGHSGVFYFHPQLDYGAGDWEGTFVPQTSIDSKIIDLPTEWFRPIGNRLVLTALDNPPTVENSLGSIALGHSGLVYDALELTQDPAATHTHDSVISAQVRPTIFYRSSSARTSGVTEEVVEADASFSAMPAEWLATLQIGGKEYRRQIKTSEEFGESQMEFNVPEWQGTTSGALIIKTPSVVRTFPVELTAAEKWTLFIVPHEHLDIGFTDYAAKVAELHSQALDGVIDLMREVPDFRWTLDGYWVLDQYVNGRAPERVNELLRLIKEGKITVPPQFANQHTGVASLEGLSRSLYDSHFFAQQHDLPLGAAHITDVPSYSWSYASILHDAGVKYFAAGSNSWRAPAVLQARWNEKSPFYWEGPDGGRVLMWYSRAYLQMATLFGTPPRVEAVRDSLPVFLQAYSGPNYKANAAIIFGTQLENTVLSKEQAYLRGEWQKQYAWPRLEYSNFAAAMREIEKQFGSDIPVYRGDLGPYWEDGFGSDSKHTALHRQNQQRIVSAEKLGTISALLNPQLRPDYRVLAQAWNNMLLFDEHTWTYVGATTQPENEQTEKQLALKGARTTEAAREITESLQRSWAQFESFLGPKDPSIVVFNPLNWRRSGLVSFDLQDGVGLFDATTGKVVPYETVSVGKSTPLPGFGGGYRRVRFTAAQVPGLGYKLYALRSVVSEDQSAASSGIKLDGTIFENSYYRIDVDPASGAISSIWDKELNRELVDVASAFRFGAYLYVTGADDMPNNSLYRYGATLKPPALSVEAAKHGRLLSAKQVPFGTVITMETSAPNTPTIQTEITLHNAKKQIDFAYRISKEPTIRKEAVYIAFPFAASNPEFGYDTQNGWVNPAKDELPGGSHEWYAVQHWAAVHDKGFMAAVIPHDAPLVTFGDIVRGKWPTEFRPSSSTVFSWLMTNYWGTNFAPQQGGKFTFHYTLVSGRTLDPAELTRLGNEAMTPLEVDQVGAAIVPDASGRLPSAEGSLLEVDNSAVSVSTWKLAEDGQGSILRLEETAGKSQLVRIRSAYLKISQVWRCSLLEDNLQELKTDGHPSQNHDSQNHSFQVEVEPFEIVTLRLRTSPDFPEASKPK
ncbi:MAG: glycosyl hydrolase-related protein [Terriglobales bacterium]